MANDAVAYSSADDVDETLTIALDNLQECVLIATANGIVVTSTDATAQNDHVQISVVLSKTTIL